MICGPPLGDPDESAGEREPAVLERKYLYTPEKLRSVLGLRGDKVIRVTFDTGYWSVWTTE
jgi:hypothetical protein